MQRIEMTIGPTTFYINGAAQDLVYNTAQGQWRMELPPSILPNATPEPTALKVALFNGRGLLYEILFFAANVTRENGRCTVVARDKMLWTATVLGGNPYLLNEMGQMNLEHQGFTPKTTPDAAIAFLLEKGWIKPLAPDA